jgi:hypothetical protein
MKKVHKLLKHYTENELAMHLGVSEWGFLKRMRETGFTKKDIKIINSMNPHSIFKESYFVTVRDNITLYCHSTCIQIFGMCFNVKTVYSAQNIFPLID